MFEISVSGSFSAAHRLRNYTGKCAKTHGHNYKVVVSVATKKIDKKKGYFIDFIELKRHLKEIMEKLDHRNLNEIEPFDVINPTAENIAKYIYEEFKKKGIKTSKVEVYEAENQWVKYSE